MNKNSDISMHLPGDLLLSRLEICNPIGYAALKAAISCIPHNEDIFKETGRFYSSTRRLQIDKNGGDYWRGRELREDHPNRHDDLGYFIIYDVMTEMGANEEEIKEVFNEHIAIDDVMPNGARCLERYNTLKNLVENNIKLNGLIK